MAFDNGLIPLAFMSESRSRNVEEIVDADEVSIDWTETIAFRKSQLAFNFDSLAETGA